MTGNWLEKCSDKQLGDVLTEKMTPHGRVNSQGRCLEGVVGDAFRDADNHICFNRKLSSTKCSNFPGRDFTYWYSIGLRFDHLCGRFGIERTNHVIRMRALQILGSRQNFTVSHTGSQRQLQAVQV